MTNFVQVGDSLTVFASRRVTLLAPDIVEAILDGRQPPGLQLDDLLTPLPPEWPKQRIMLGFSPGEQV